MRAISLLSRFRRDDSGATATIVAVSIVPLVIVIAAATDYARVADFRTRMQTGVDSAAIAMAKQPGSLSNTQLAAKGRPVFNAHATAKFGYTTVSFTATRSGRTISVAAAGQVQSSFGAFLGKPVIDIHANAVVAAGSKRIELALVLDNTGSMATRQKMQKLKEASNLLLDKLQAAVMSPDDVKVSVVPFATQVRVPSDVSNAPPNWVRFSSDREDSREIKDARPHNWQGCIVDRAQTFNNYDTNDKPPVISIRDSLYVASQCESTTQARMLPLTNDFPRMRATINSMRPDGCTNVTIGAAWGLASLSDDAPLTGAVPLGDPDVQKIMILLTDGLNTKNRFVEARGCGGRGDDADIDARTRIACNSVLNAATPATRIRTYAIRVIEGDESLLRGCAGNGGKYYNVQNPNDLDAVFQSIAEEITRIRLTS